MAIVGIGGGSDGIQAAQLAQLFAIAGKQIPCVLSIRTSQPESQDPRGETAAARTIQNHGGEIVSGVFRVKPESSGSGRFLENIPAAQVPVYLVIDEKDDTLASRIQAAITHAGGADTILAVDTGGDALYSSTVTDGSKATPDQDLRVLHTLKDLSQYDVFTAEVAVGVDSPPNAQEVLAGAQATYYSLNATEAQHVLEAYRRWKMDGSDEDRFGKTAFAWQSALTGKFGMVALPLPTRVVLDRKNPWNPFVHIDASMQGIFFMRLADHLNSISQR